MKWYLEDVEGWQAPLDSWSPERDMGTALHAGMAAYWLGGEKLSPLDEATQTLKSLWPETAPDEYSLEGMTELLGKIILRQRVFFTRDMAGADPVMVEQPLGEDGHTTPDLVTREHGELVVTDLKYHHYVPADRIQYRFDHIDRDHQFNHYPWAVSEYLGEPVRRFRKLGVIGLPKIVIRAAEFEVTEQQQAAWLMGARQKWHQMDRMIQGGPEMVYQRQEGCRPFGDKYPCPMEQACWTCHLDREQMTKFYRKGEPR